MRSTNNPTPTKGNPTIWPVPGRYLNGVVGPRGYLTGRTRYGIGSDQPFQHAHQSGIASDGTASGTISLRQTAAPELAGATTVAFTATVNLAETVCEPTLVYVALGDTLIEMTESSPALAARLAQTPYHRALAGNG
ncbi:MAG TPA: hypothetical protein VFM37_13075 [Pseudonocardiaceae bacterium]|nr:hypothetical protein [Pseudonocardiaceae bacterium]